MYCKGCGAQLKDGAKFCTHCGRPVDYNSNDHGHESGSKEKIRDSTLTGKKKKSLVVTILLAAAISLATVAVVVIGLIILREGGFLDLKNDTIKRDESSSAVESSFDQEDMKEVETEVSTIVEENIETLTEASIIQTMEEPTTQYVPPEDHLHDDNAIHSYMFIHQDISWQDAWNESIKAGGYLARITTPEEYEAVLSVLSAYDNIGLHYVYLGGMRDNVSIYHWKSEDGELFSDDIANPSSWYYQYWYPGEPSYNDPDEKADGRYISEYCMSLMRVKDVWYFNDASGDMANEYPNEAGKIGYLVEFEQPRNIIRSSYLKSKNGSINIRSKPTHNSDLVATVDHDTAMWYQQEKATGVGADGLEHEWLKIWTDGLEGWVRSDLVNSFHGE